jgi:NADPH-dependent 2,4-dienoyl-CoA reductase/sulfur reductase-like enzyme
MACPKIACECHPGGRKMRKLGAHVLLWGDGYAAADTAAFLASIGKQVTIVTEHREFGAELEVIHMYVQLKRFAQADAEVLHSRPYKHPVAILTGSTVHEIRAGEVVLQDKDFQRTTLQVDDVVTCHVRPDDALFHELREAGIQVINVGDSVRPRNLYWAVKEGSAFGLAVDEHALFNPNHAILNELPIDVLAQLTREEAPSYTAERLQELMDAVNGSAQNETVPA